MKHKAVAKTQSKVPAARVPVRRQPLRLPTPVVQPSLRVGAVNDPAEREAETMAARVVGASAPTLAAAPAAQGGAAANAPAAPLRRNADNQPNTDELVPTPPPADHADFDLPSTQDVATDNLDAADLSELESGEPQDIGGEVALARRAERPGAVVGRMGGPAPKDVAALVANPGPGRPLPSGLRARVEPHFETSFEDVRLHDKPADRDAAARIGARAFTHGNHIWLADGESPTNTRLMAHELTHVVQQTQRDKALPLHRDAVQREPIRRDDDDEGYIEGWLEDKARYVPGYTLATVILGRTLISGRRVLKTATNLLQGIFGLHPLGTVLFDKLQETNMITDAFTWVSDRLGELNLTWSRVRGLVDRVLDLSPIRHGLDDVIAIFAPITRDLITFAVDVGKKVLEFAVRGALKLAGPYADRVWAIIEQARDVIHLIVEDPLGFAMNLVRAVVGGFRKFGVNILTHLKNGILGWLFGAIAGAGITMPERLDFKGLMSLVMQILGLTYANFRRILVRQLGPRGERIVSMIETSVEIVRILITEGFAGIWQKMLEMIENFKTTLISGLVQMVTTNVISAGIGWLAGLSNPVGAVVRVIKGIYDLIVAFLERLDQIMEVAQAIFSSVGAIARGETEPAANFVEQVIGRTVPVVISFLAAALGLGGISTSIRRVIDRLQAPILRAMERLVAFVVKKAKKMFSALIRRLNGRRRLPSVPFMVGDTPHEIQMHKDGRKVKYMIASDNPKEKDVVATATTRAANEIEAERAKQEAQRVAEEVADLAAKMERHENINTESERQPTGRPMAASSETATTEVAEITSESATLIDEVGVTTEVDADDAALVRGEPGRIEALEGMVGTYDHVASEKARLGEAAGLGRDELQRYELDHVVEKQYAINILNNLDRLDPNAPSDGTVMRDLPETAAGNRQRVTREADNAAQRFGLLGSGDYQTISPSGGILPVIATYKLNHQRVTGGADGGSARALVERALAAPTDKHGVLRTALQEQLTLEVQSVVDMISGDTTAPPEIVANVRAGLTTIQSDNARIYALGQQSEVPAASPDAGVNDTAAHMNGEGRSPNFRQMEGAGSAYGSAQSGNAGYLENDHVVDKAYPKNIAELPLLTDTQKASLDTTIKSNFEVDTIGALPNDVQNRRRRVHNRALFFGARHPMRTFTDATGWSIPLYKPLADRVTAATGERTNFASFAAQGETSMLSHLATFIAEGTDGSLASAEQAAQGPVKDKLSSLTEHHMTAITSQYREEFPRIRQANPNAQAQAEAALREITGRVAVSLQAAREQTRTLTQ
ncbi:DUF4157 domain-containing protein [uncultured Litoreibacter sp.]|uniref:eCIS core domain-containing protein n=1 Tax=uncultured Litoreibacter sp. TaxID=1392394 RepID=UPI00262F65D2|nr:DUF4157 domain-containing protein [uncultured Litoreibacter sp.]